MQIGSKLYNTTTAVVGGHVICCLYYSFMGNNLTNHEQNMCRYNRE